MFPFRFMAYRRRGLRMMVLSALSTGPKNGVELMNEIETMTRGWWRPSPGSMYPLLEQLSAEGLLKKGEDGRYQLTERAGEQMEWSFGPFVRRPQSEDEMLKEMGAYVSYFEELGSSDKSKLEPHKARLRELKDRLSKLT